MVVKEKVGNEPQAGVFASIKNIHQLTFSNIESFISHDIEKVGTSSKSNFVSNNSRLSCFKLFTGNGIV